MMGKLCGILTCLLIQLPCLLSATTYQRSQFVELSAANITSNVKDWEVDLAVMFYAPWCKYCKQLAPSMARMAELQESKKELVFGKYNCEQSDTDVKLCRALGITQYPSVYFFGFGNFNQAPKGNIFGRSDFSRMVKYTADLIPEAIYDWILMLQSISSWQRRWDDVKGFFTGNSRLSRRVKRLQEENAALQYKTQLFGEELEKLKADDLFGRLTDNGDPFPLLSQLEPDEQNLPLRVCVAEMATEFCSYHMDEEMFCRTIDKCSKQDMKPVACRPATCPFSNKLGCVVTSQCLDTEVVLQYKESLFPSAKSKAGAGLPTGPASSSGSGSGSGYGGLAGSASSGGSSGSSSGGSGLEDALGRSGRTVSA